MREQNGIVSPLENSEENGHDKPASTNLSSRRNLLTNDTGGGGSLFPYNQAAITMILLGWEFRWLGRSVLLFHWFRVETVCRSGEKRLSHSPSSSGVTLPDPWCRVPSMFSDPEVGQYFWSDSPVDTGRHR